MVRQKKPRVLMGRPPKPLGVGRDHRVVTFVTEQEYAELKALAESRQVSLSALCHNLIVTTLRKKS